MAKKQKVERKNGKKGLAPQTKRNLINVFKSLISNQAAVDGAKEAPFWIAIIFLVLSVCLPVIPIIVAQQKIYGSNFLAGYSYSADRGLANTTMELEDQGYVFKVQGGNLSFNKDVSEEAAVSDIIEKYDNEGNAYQVYNFRFYITNKTGGALSDYAQRLSEIQYLEKSLDLYTAAHETAGLKSYKASFIIVAPETMMMALYKAETKDGAASSLGGLNWSHTGDIDNLLSKLDNDMSLTDNARRDNIYKNWKGLFDEAYIAQRDIATRNMSLIYLGVYTGLVIFLGGMIFLLTRGKNNVYNYLNFFTCQFIAWWASFTPAVLGMILGFVFSTNMIGQMAFIVLLSIRIMWLSMRQLRPVQ